MSHVGAGRRHLNQKATYWPKASDDGYGNSVSTSPQIVKVRWEDVTEEKFSVQYQFEGEVVISRAQVFTELALQEGGYIYLGETTESNPARVEGAFVIRKTATIPSLRGDRFENVSYL